MKNRNSKACKIWHGMKQRCFNKNALAYKDYGGRGITICKRWMKFENFFDDMGECPDGLTIERINNNGNYEPGNCKWATYKEQLNNRRNNIVLSYKGKKQTISQWARELKIDERGIRHRISKGMTVEEALNENGFDDNHHVVDKDKYSYYKQPTLLQRLKAEKTNEPE